MCLILKVVLSPPDLLMTVGEGMEEGGGGLCLPLSDSHWLSVTVTPGLLSFSTVIHTFFSKDSTTSGWYLTSPPPPPLLSLGCGIASPTTCARVFVRAWRALVLPPPPPSGLLSASAAESSADRHLSLSLVSTYLWPAASSLSLWLMEKARTYCRRLLGGEGGLTLEY